MKRIEDDLAGLRLSKQRKYQIRKMRQGRCIICADDAFEGTLLCFRHHLKKGTRRPGRNKSKHKKWLESRAANIASYSPLFLSG